MVALCNLATKIYIINTTVIIVMAVLAILGSAFVVATTGEGLQAINHQHKTQAHYYARSGAYMGLEWLESEEGKEWLKTENLGEKYLSGNLGSGLAVVTEETYLNDTENEIKLEISEDGGEIELKSDGRFKGKIEKVTISNIDLSKSEGSSVLSSIDKLIFANGEGGEVIKISDNPNYTIDGPRGESGKVKVGTAAKKASSNIDETLLDVEYEKSKYELPVFPKNLDEKGSINTNKQIILEMGEYESVNLNGQGSATVNLNGGDSIMRVGSLSLGNGGLKVKGTGRLILYVDSSISVGGSGGISNDDGAKVIIFFGGTNELKFTGAMNMAGLIYAPNAKVVFGGNSTLKGAVVANKFDGGNSKNAYLIFDNSFLTGLDDLVEFEDSDGSGSNSGIGIDKSKKVWSGE